MRTMFTRFSVKSLTLAGFIILNCQFIIAQNSFKAIVKDESNKEALIGVNALLENTNTPSTSDATGSLEIKNIPDGEHCIIFSFIGYENKKVCLTFPLKNPTETITVELKPAGKDLNEFIVTSTRNNTRIEDLPIKVEVIGSDDLEDGITRHQANISELLTQYIGIMAQQTSQTSGNINLRMQGLDGGKYVKILKDGFPLNDGFAEGLNVMEIPPLDLKQVEIIKGTASTLFGGDAIAGSINLISKEPKPKTDLSFFASQSTLKETDLGTFFSKRMGNFGITFLASYQREDAVDINHDGLSDQPKVRGFTINPKFFYYFNNTTKLTLSVSTGKEDRNGGDMNVLNGHADSVHSYFQTNHTTRNYYQLLFEKTFSNGNVFSVKNSIGLFDRSIGSSISYDGNPSSFEGKQISSWSEISFLQHLGKNDLVTGIDFSTDKYSDTTVIHYDSNIYRRGYNYSTFGLFVQDDWKASKKTTIQAGVRGDFHNTFGTFVLPHLSILYKWNDKLSTRLGGGLGYKVPTFFEDDAEMQGFGTNVLPPLNLKAETSEGINLDFNYKTFFSDDARINVNESFFYTTIQNTVDPAGERLDSNGYLVYANGDPVTAMGAETNINFTYRKLNVIAGYTFVSAQEEEASHNLAVTPKHRVIIDLMYGKESKWKAGAEAFYTGQQYLRTGSEVPDYWVLSAVIQRKFKNFLIAFNLENLLNVRQSNYESLYTGTLQNPVFREIWAPMEGFKANVSVRINL